MDVSIACFIAVLLAGMSGCQQADNAIQIDNDDIGGIVSGPNGPEAGVWVIAETTDLPTRLNKIVVTDADGRYVIPDLPSASYAVWVRGYGLVDSPKVEVGPGTIQHLDAIPAPDPRSAAHYYPAGYWFSLLQVPGEEEFPGTGPAGNGLSPNMASRAEWLRNLKSGGCMQCHQLGNQPIREIPEDLGDFEASVAAWDRRIESGQAGGV